MLYVRLFLLIWLAFVFGCSPRSANLTLPIEPPKAFSSHASHALSERWWTAFGDARMDSLVDRALQSNFSLETAWHRLRSAQAIVDREGAVQFPTLTVSGRGEVQRPNSENDAQIHLGITSEYEIDLWGRIRSGVDAARYRMRATEADYQTAALSLSAEVVRTYFQLMEAQNQHELFEHQIETNQQVLSLIRARFGSGQIRSVDILRQRQLVESTREQKIATESRIEVLEHQLAVLSGYAPQDGIAYTHRVLPDLPPLPDTGLPVELIQRRPDVKRAYNLLLAADRDVAVAISNRYPRLSLTALASGKDWVGNLIGNLLLPVIDGGERGAEIRRNQANKSAQLSAYGQTVLTALAEVENALVQEQKQVERIASLEMQVALMRQTYDQLRLEYLNGISDYLDVLTALTNEQRLRRSLISANLDLLEFRIALYRALAGGFEIARKSNAR